MIVARSVGRAKPILVWAPPVGRDMIGFVAFDFVLRIVFRSVMDMTFVIKVRGMDGDDGPCHAAGFGIPAYMIAYLESPTHL